VSPCFTAVPVMGAEGTMSYTPSDDEMAEVEAGAYTRSRLSST